MRDALVPLLDKHFAEFVGPFIWGERDCVTFTANWVERATGKNTIPPGLVWHDEETAAYAMRVMGCANARELAAKFLTPKPLLSARLGDIVCRELRRGQTLGICTGADVAFIDQSRGLLQFRLSKCNAAWAVE